MRYIRQRRIHSKNKREEIKEITMKVSAPLNVLSLPGLTNCNKLKEAGVNRFSFGNALSDKVIAFLENNAAQLVALNGCIAFI
jgi:2-methylisocitrate lyase-like PEP mutase family enzyme